MSTVTEIWNVLQNIKSGGGLGWLVVSVTQGHQQCHSSIQRIMISYSSLIETMRLSCTVFEINPKIALVICQNSLTSTYPTCIWRPRWGDTFRILASLNHSPWAIMRVVRVILRLAVLVEHRLVTDRQTQTDTGPYICLLYTSDAADE